MPWQQWERILKKTNQECETSTLRQFIEEHYKPWSEAHHQWPEVLLRKLNYLSGFLDVPLDQISPHEVEKWRTVRLNSGISANTVNRDLIGLKGALTKAAEWDLIQEHPIRKIKQLKIDHLPNIRYLTEEEGQQAAIDERQDKIRSGRERGNNWRKERDYKFYSSLSKDDFVDHIKPMILLALNTGLRRGELFRLQWGDVDFDRKNLTVVMRGKRKSFMRHIPLNTAREQLQAAKASTFRWGVLPLYLTRYFCKIASLLTNI